jgi:uncharacterized protein
MGTILNIIIISLVLELSVPYLPVFTSPYVRIIVAALGVIFIGLGGGIYLIANLGPGPRDGLMIGIQKLTSLPIAWVRSTIEVSVVLLGWSLGSVVGVGTLLFAFSIGPCAATTMIVFQVFFCNQRWS